MTPQELKEIQEPPADTIAEINFEWTQPQHFRHFRGIGWLDVRNIAWDDKGKYAVVPWEEIVNIPGITAAHLWKRPENTVAALYVILKHVKNRLDEPMDQDGRKLIEDIQTLIEGEIRDLTPRNKR